MRGVGSIILFLIALGFQVSGWVNSSAAVGIWIVAALLSIFLIGTSKTVKGKLRQVASMSPALFVGVAMVAGALLSGVAAVAFLKYGHEPSESRTPSVPPLPGGSPPVSFVRRLSADKIILVYRYGTPFDPYKGVPSGPNVEWILDPDVPVTKRFVPKEKVDLNIGFEDKNEGVALDTVVLQVTFSEKVKVILPKIKKPKKTDQWIAQATGLRYTYQWSDFPTKARNPDWPLPTIFPSAKEFLLTCTISIRSGNEMLETDKVFKVLLY